MRTLDERMEEIAVRSEKRLKARKKRRIAVLSVCIPVMLCVGLILPHLGVHQEVEAMDTADNAAAAQSVEVVTADKIAYSAANCALGVEAVTELIDEILLTTDTRGMLINDENVVDSAVEVGTEIEDVEMFSITITREDGTVDRYLLQGTELIDQDTQIVYELDTQTRERLLQSLMPDED